MTDLWSNQQHGNFCLTSSGSNQKTSLSELPGHSPAQSRTVLPLNYQVVLLHAQGMDADHTAQNKISQL